MRQETILVLDDEKLIRWSVREKLEGQGYTVLEAGSGEEALRLLAGEECDLLLLDYRLPDMTGLEVLEQVRRDSAEVTVIMMTAYGTVENAVQAMKFGAFDYLTKPVNADELMVVVEKALETTRLRREVRLLRSERIATRGEVRIVGKSRELQEIIDLIGKVATSQATTILLEGESGTGKNLVARALHHWGARSEQPFVTITCPAITETLLESELFGHERGSFTDAKSMKKGLLEMADGGTVFLDEISEMGPSMQAKLLRFLEDRAFKRVGGVRDIVVDVLVVAATNRNLDEEVEQGRFREDLYYRLKVIPILLPALRQRRDDIPLLAQHFLDHYNREFHKATLEVAADAMEALVRHPWYGNVRELKNVIERVMILENKERIQLSDLPLSLKRGQSRVPAQVAAPSMPVGDMTLEEMEKSAIIEALRRSGHNQVKAARLLGVSRDTLRYRLKKFGLGENAGRDDAGVEESV